ncbi:MAG: hypothetical protein DRP20_00250, partial [Thermotogae bacterium]
MNSIYNNSYGVFVASSSDYTLIIGNNITGNSNEGVHVNGNNEQNNHTQIHFNNIYNNVNNVNYTNETVSINATRNWWGATVESSIQSGISGNVIYTPWLMAEYDYPHCHYESVPSGVTLVDGKDATSTTLLVSTAGPNNVTITKYAGNPGGNLPGYELSALGFWDIHADNDVAWVNISIYYTQADLDAAGIVEDEINGMYHWDGTDWVLESNTGVNMTDQDGYAGYVWANVTDLSPFAPLGVDTVPPVTTIDFSPDPYVNSTGAEFISCHTLIYLNATDNGTGPGQTWYRVFRQLPDGSWTAEIGGSHEFVPYDGPFTLDQSCYHEIEYLSYDNAGNEEGQNDYKIHVDCNPPQMKKVYIGPYLSNPPEEWINLSTQIQISAPYDNPVNTTQFDRCASGVKNLTYEIKVWDYVNGEYKTVRGPITIENPPFEVTFTINNTCRHAIYFWSYDNVGNVNDSGKNEPIYVDNTPPHIEKDISSEYIVRSNEKVADQMQMNNTEAGLGLSGVKTNYQTFTPSQELLDAINVSLSTLSSDYGNVTLTLYDDSLDVIDSVTKDLSSLGALDGDWIQFDFLNTIHLTPGGTYIFDLSTPHAYAWNYTFNNTYTRGMGWRIDPLLSGKPFDWAFKTEYHPIDSYVTTSTEFNLSYWDEGCNGGVGLNETFGLKYRIWWHNSTSDEWQLIPWKVNHSGTWDVVGPGWRQYDGNFSFMEECTHRIEMMAKDELGNVQHINQTHHVDMSPPKIFKLHHGCHEEFAEGKLQSLNESFEDRYVVHPFPPAGWLTFNRGDDYSGASWLQWIYDSYIGNYSAACHAGENGEFQKEWLVTPAIHLQENPVFSFWHMAKAESNDNAPNEIWISTTGYTPDDFENNGEKLLSWQGDIPTNWAQVILDSSNSNLSRYVNRTVWIAFCYQSTDGEMWMIDNVTCNGNISAGRYMQPWDNITLEVRDMPEGACSVGLNHTEIFWRYEYGNEMRPYNQTDPLNSYYGTPVLGKGGLWWWHTTDSKTNLTFYEGCRHDLYYYYNASDLLNNTVNSTVYHQVYYVDDVEPTITEKTHPLCYYPIVTNETVFYDNMENWQSRKGYNLPRWDRYVINGTVATHPGGWLPDSDYHSPVTSSFHNNDTVTANMVDDWLVTPLIQLPARNHMVGDIWLDFWEKNANMSRYYGNNAHSVWISLAGPNPDPNGDGNISDGNYTLLAEFSQVTNSWTLRHINLSAYAGHTVYIAFRYMGNNSSKWWIDDVEVRYEVENPGFISAGTPIHLTAKDYPEEKFADQKQEKWNTWEYADGSYQTFVPNASSLDAVKLLLAGSEGVWINVSIYQGSPDQWSYAPTLLGYSVKHIPPSGSLAYDKPIWWQFHFVPSITLRPGENYTIVVRNAGTYYWCIDSSNPYSRGSAYVNNGGDQLPESDFAFRTEYWTGSESECMSDIQHKFYRYERFNESSGGWDWNYPDDLGYETGSFATGNWSWNWNSTAIEQIYGNVEVMNISKFYNESTISDFFGGHYLWFVYNDSIGVRFYENCTHRLYYFTKDNVCHHSEVYMQTYYVDDKKPVVDITYPSHGYYTPVSIEVDPTFANETVYWLNGTFHVNPTWVPGYGSPSAPHSNDGWIPNPATSGQFKYKKQNISFTITNNDLQHDLSVNLTIEEIVGDGGITLINGTFVDLYSYIINVGAGETKTENITVYDDWNSLRMGVWSWKAKISGGVTQYLRAGVNVTLTAHDHDLPENKVVDQQQTTCDAWDAIEYISQPPLYTAQSFIPTATRLDAVQLLLDTSSGGNVTVTILDDPLTSLIPLGSSTLYIPPNTHDEWVQFHFNPPIPLTPGKAYWITASCFPDGGVTWRWNNTGDSYPNGHMVRSGSHDSSHDYAFKTEYNPHCPSGVEGIYWRYVWNNTEYPREGAFGAINGSELSVYGYDENITGHWWYVTYNDRVNISFNEECQHELYYFAKDNTCHNSTVHHEIYYVDGSVPVVDETLPDHGAIGNTTVSLHEDFEVPFTSWYNTSGWYRISDFWPYYYGNYPHSGRYCAYGNGGWLISPRIPVPADGNLTFWYRSDGSGEFEINVSTDPDQKEVNAFTTRVWNSGTFNDPIYRKVEIDLSAYAGHQIYAGFHVLSGDVFIDDVWLGGIHRIATPFEDNMENTTESMGKWTTKDLTVERNSYWQGVERVPIYINNDPAPAVNCFDGGLGNYNTFGMYGCNWNDTLTMKTPIDLSAVATTDHVWFNFTLWMDIQGNDALYVDASNDSINWTELASWNADVQPWALQSVDLSDYIGNNTVWVRFRFVSDDDNTPANGVFIDNITIENSTTNLIFSDYFGSEGNPDMSKWVGHMLDTSR